MAGVGSYTSTLRNNGTESEGLAFLFAQDPKFIRLDKSGRKRMLELFDLAPTFSRAFDCVFFTGDGLKPISEMSREEVILVELKTTKKKLLDNPKGFFFGATHNEFDLAKKLGDRYRFCFISLHPESLSYKLLSLAEVNKIIRTKRLQYQINF